MSTQHGVHYLLFSEARLDGREGSWRFVLSEVGASDSLVASDVEPITCRERLELFALVRGLEAIDRPARVTLVTNSRYVIRGLKHGLNDWRACHWQWERFGHLVPVRDGDLWRRVDRALEFHELDCRLWRFDAQTSDAGDVTADTDHFAYPVKNLRRRTDPADRWEAAEEPAALAAG